VIDNNELPTCPPFDQLPARLGVSHVAVQLGFSESDIPILIAGGLLKPLGNPAPNAPKFFARVKIERCAQDIVWLDRATRFIAQYWKRKRDQKPKRRRLSDE